MRLVIDNERCEGHGRCYSIAKDLFEPDDIGNGVVIGGQVAIVNHVQIGDGAQIAGQSGVIRDIAPGEAVMGYPAKPIRQFWREIAALSRLTKRDKTP